MSLRRTVALWLCPELVEQPVAQVDYYPSAEGWARETLGNAEAATDAAWKAEVLEQLKAMNAQMSQLVESSRAASEHVRNAARNLHEVTEGGNAMRVVAF